MRLSLEAISTLAHKWRTDDGLVRIKLAFVGAAAILLWDYAVTFQLERAVLWTRKNSIAKVSTLLARYVRQLIPRKV